MAKITYFNHVPQGVQVIQEDGATYDVGITRKAKKIRLTILGKIYDGLTLTLTYDETASLMQKLHDTMKQSVEQG